MAKRSMFVGMDVHKESIDISLAEEGRDGEVRHYGRITGDLEALAKVVNPSSMPKRSGDRIKTDRRDGDALARLHRAGELTPIYIPRADDEALRDLVRAREDAVGLSTQAKHRLKAFLLRHGRRYPGRARWTPSTPCRSAASGAHDRIASVRRFCAARRLQRLVRRPVWMVHCPHDVHGNRTRGRWPLACRSSRPAWCHDVRAEPGRSRRPCTSPRVARHSRAPRTPGGTGRVPQRHL